MKDMFYIHTRDLDIHILLATKMGMKDLPHTDLPGSESQVLVLSKPDR